MNWLTRLVFGSLTIGAPSLVALGGFIDWKERVFSQASGINRWLKKAWEEGGGNVKEGLAEIKKEVLDSADGKHPGMEVYSVEEYMRKIYESEREVVKEDGKYKWLGNNDKSKIVEKIIFDKNTEGSKLKMVVNKKGEGVKEGFLKGGENGICIFSVESKDNQSKSNLRTVDVIIGFVKDKWTVGKEVTVSVEMAKLEEPKNSDWCESRAKRFSDEQNFMIGISLGGWEDSQNVYKPQQNAYGYIGKLENNGWNRIYEDAKYSKNEWEGTWPVVLGAIQRLGVKEGRFESADEVKSLGKLYCGKEECWKGNGRGKNRPVGVRFENVNITGRSLSDWSTNP